MADVESLEAGSSPARTCVEFFKISCLQCHQFLMDLEPVVGTSFRTNCKAGECRIYNLVKLIDEDGCIKVVQWLEPKIQSRNVRY